MATEEPDDAEGELAADLGPLAKGLRFTGGLETQLRETTPEEEAEKLDAALQARLAEQEKELEDNMRTAREKALAEAGEEVRERSLARAAEAGSHADGAAAVDARGEAAAAAAARGAMWAAGSGANALAGQSPVSFEEYCADEPDAEECSACVEQIEKDLERFTKEVECWCSRGQAHARSHLPPAALRRPRRPARHDPTTRHIHPRGSAENVQGAASGARLLLRRGVHGGCAQPHPPRALRLPHAHTAPGLLSGYGCAPPLVHPRGISHLTASRDARGTVHCSHACVAGMHSIVAVLLAHMGDEQARRH